MLRSLLQWVSPPRADFRVDGTGGIYLSIKDAASDVCLTWHSEAEARAWLAAATLALDTPGDL